MTDTVYGQIEEFLDDLIERAEAPKKKVEFTKFKKSKTRKANLTDEEARDLDNCVGLLVDRAKLIHKDLLTINPDKAPQVLNDAHDIIEKVKKLSDEPSCKEFNRILKLAKKDELLTLKARIGRELDELERQRKLPAYMSGVAFRAMEGLRKKQESVEREARLRGKYERVTGKPLGGGRRRTLRKRRRSRSRKAL